MYSLRKRSLRVVAVCVGAVIGLMSTAPHASAHLSDTATTPGSPRVATLDSCPVGGPAEYVDSWGDSRSGGRRHEGVDMAATRGTPVLAVRGGEAEFKRSNLGGNSIWLVALSGERYYYAHLDGWEGSSRTVTAGEVIGYVGSSGNARGDHLHFETRLGEQATNPYPLVEAACSPGASPDVPRVGARLPLS